MALAGALAACDDRAVAGTDAGSGTASDSGGGITADSGGGATTDSGVMADLTSNPPSAGACVVAIRVDDCCLQAKPVSLDEVKRDPCLVLWGNHGLIPAVCKAKWRPICAVIDCAAVAPPTHVAARVNGTCQFADECKGSANCAVATNVTRCCACPRAVSATEMLYNPCLIAPGDNRPRPAECSVTCDAVKCKPCPPTPGVRCVQTASPNGYNRCTSVP